MTATKISISLGAHHHQILQSLATRYPGKSVSGLIQQLIDDEHNRQKGSTPDQKLDQILITLARLEKKMG